MYGATLISFSVDVPVEVIASFNKMKSLTEDRTLIVKAMKNSSLLEVPRGFYSFLVSMFRSTMFLL